ncbi:MAG: hypothetical protein KDA69_10540 [Planctomycetaceae bacterium]|nr:hypothetical protein [Planctomycetaceae bacterium]MCA9044748.1 hypothetical protein [Planctomycetaceae bacterium]
MNGCQEFRNALDELVLSRESAPLDVVQHGEHCPVAECQAAWEEFRLLNSAIATWQAREALMVVPSFKIETTAPAVASSSTNKPLPETKRSEAGLARWLALSVAGVALFSLLSLVGSNLRNDPQVATIEAPTTTDIVDPPVLVAVEETEEGNAAIRDLGTTYVSWIDGSTDRITDTVAFVLVEPSHDEGSTSHTGWLESLQQGWQPLESSLQETFQELLEPGSVDMGNAS